MVRRSLNHIVPAPSVQTPTASEQVRHQFCDETELHMKGVKWHFNRLHESAERCLKQQFQKQAVDLYRCVRFF